jgi:hypothetical protein
MPVFTVPSHNYPAGATPFGPIDVPAGSTRIDIGLLRESWPDSGGAEIISIVAEFSFDGGVTWPRAEGFGCAGGVLPLDKFGQPQLTSHVGPWIITTPCRVRGVVTLSQPLTTTITLTLT